MYGRRTIRLYGMARQLWTLQRGNDDLVFTSVEGDRINQQNLQRRVLTPAAEKAGVPWLTFHGLRHTCGSILFRNGWNAKQVQKWLGHHSPAFTLDVYVHLLDGDLPEPSFFDAEGEQQGAAHPTETGLNEAADTKPVSASNLAAARAV